MVSILLPTLGIFCAASFFLGLNLIFCAISLSKPKIIDSDACWRNLVQVAYQFQPCHRLIKFGRAHFGSSRQFVFALAQNADEHTSRRSADRPTDVYICIHVHFFVLTYKSSQRCARALYLTPPMIIFRPRGVKIKCFWLFYGNNMFTHTRAPPL